MTRAQDLPWTEDEDEWRSQSGDYRVDPGHEGDWMPTREAFERLGGNDAPILVLLRDRRLEAKAHAVLFGTVGDPDPAGRYHTTVRDTIVPDAFWQQCCEPGSSRLDWNAGCFEGRSEYLNMAIEAVQLRRSQFDAVFPPIENAPLAARLQADAQPPSRRGRKPKEIWVKIGEEWSGAIWRGTAIPKSQADIERWIEARLDAHGQTAAESTVRLRAQGYWKEYVEADN